jgi:crotonobetainyl-CoA:carnitine CoA-transferase CaiB-like acyl-CoA transferase
MTPSPLPLERFRVLDLSRVRAGPTAVRQFADWGAQVLMVEPKEQLNDIVGSRNSSDFQNLNRNKRSIALDLKTPEGRKILLALIARSDVLFENFRPDVKYRLGIDFETAQRINPRLVYVSISGFGQSGPYRDRPGLDQVAQGMGGLMSVTGEPGKPPMRSGIAVADSSTGLYAAIGAMTALLEREITGKGRWVRASLLQSQIAMMDFQAARWLVDHEVPEPVGNDHPTAVPMGMYRSSDGYLNVAASGKTLFERFCKVAGCERLLADERFIGSRRKANRKLLRAEIETIVIGKSTAQWVDILNSAGVPCGPVYRMDEVFADPQVEHLKIAQAVDHPRLGTLSLVGQPFALDDETPPLRCAAPDAGQHTAEVLRELGYSDATIGELAERKVI